MPLTYTEEVVWFVLDPVITDKSSARNSQGQRPPWKLTPSAVNDPYL